MGDTIGVTNNLSTFIRGLRFDGQGTNAPISVPIWPDSASDSVSHVRPPVDTNQADKRINNVDISAFSTDLVNKGQTVQGKTELKIETTYIMGANGKILSSKKTDKNGSMVEEGSFEELLSKKEGHFYFHWQSQRLGVER